MEEKKIRVRLFFMYMPYIKFQDSSIRFVHKVVPIQNAYVRKRGITQPKIYGWLVGCFGFNGPLRQYFSLYRAISQREGERGERIDESKNVQTTPTRSYCKHNRPLPYCNQNCRTPRHWKFTQHHRTTRPPPKIFGIGSKVNQFIYILVCNYLPNIRILALAVFQIFC